MSESNAKPLAVSGLEVQEYLLALDTSGLTTCIVSVVQRDGSVMWKVRAPFNEVLARNGEWIEEPMPSERSVAFLAATRYSTPEAALEAWLAAERP